MMKICMVVYNLYEFGGLEDIATTLAIALRQKGHDVCLLSSGWVAPHNQYKKRLMAHHVPVVQMPRWLVDICCDWSTKEKLAARLVWLLTPLVYLAATLLLLSGRRSWSAAVSSARNWLRQQCLSRLIGPDRREPLFRLLLAWWRLRWRPDLLHIHGYTEGLLFVVEWAHKHNLPTVYEEHQTPDAGFDWWNGFQQRINLASVVVAVSEKSAQALAQLCKVERPIITMTPIVSDPYEKGWQESPTTLGQQVRITTIARLYVTKGLNYLLEAIVQVRKSYPNTQFCVYGSGPLREELMAYAAALELDGAAIFVGTFEQTELPALMAETDLFVLPSILEGLPVTIVEAMAYGRPIVATTVGGIPELIKDGVNGLLCPAHDSKALAGQILRLLDNHDLRIQLGKNARKTYEGGTFHPQQVGERILGIYKLAQQCHRQMSPPSQRRFVGSWLAQRNGNRRMIESAGRDNQS
jgi:glycosyltransferase involved in cell wall biosynthesis